MTYIPIFIWLAIMHQFNTLGAEFNMHARYGRSMSTINFYNNFIIPIYIHTY